MRIFLGTHIRVDLWLKNNNVLMINQKCQMEWWHEEFTRWCSTYLGCVLFGLYLACLIAALHLMITGTWSIVRKLHYRLCLSRGFTIPGLNNYRDPKNFAKRPNCWQYSWSKFGLSWTFGETCRGAQKRHYDSWIPDVFSNPEKNGLGDFNPVISGIHFNHVLLNI